MAQAQLEEEDRKNQEGNLEKYELDVLHYTMSGFWFLAYGRVKKNSDKTCTCSFTTRARAFVHGSL